MENNLPNQRLVGGTGTGKSETMAAMIRQDMESGRGVTLLDPYGTTVDLVLRTVPERYQDRVRVVRLGQLDAPVPLSPWKSGDYTREKPAMEAVARILAESLPRLQQSRYNLLPEWFAAYGNLALMLMGERTSLEGICRLSASYEWRTSQVLELLPPGHKEALRPPYGQSEKAVRWELHDLLLPVLSAAPLRTCFGAAGNALDFPASMDTDAVTLIDLGAAALDEEAVRVMGALLLHQLWDGARRRSRRDLPHHIYLDDAWFFCGYPLPELLSAGRKLGLRTVAAYQYEEQLHQRVRGAVLANCVPISVAPPAETDVPTDGEIAKRIESRSRKTLSTPYLGWGQRALSPSELQRFFQRLGSRNSRLTADNLSADLDLCADKAATARPVAETWLGKWVRYRISQAQEGRSDGAGDAHENEADVPPLPDDSLDDDLEDSFVFLDYEEPFDDWDNLKYD